MQILTNPDSLRALQGVTSDADVRFPVFLSNQVLPVTVGVIDRAQVSPTSSARLWDPRDIAGWTIRIGLGKAFQPPVAGTFTLTFGANTTAAINFNCTAADVATALNLLASIIAAGFVSVTGEAGYFVITFLLVGVRAQISMNIGGLAPLSIGEPATLVEGTASRKEIQTIRFFQNPGAYANLTVANAAADAVADMITVGGGGFNAKIRVTISGNPYDGSWSIVILGIESELIPLNATSAQVQTALEAMETVGVGQVGVVQESQFAYVLYFKGTLANTNLGLAPADGTLLRAISTKGGELDLRTAAISLLLGSATTTSVILEIEGTPPAASPVKLVHQSVTLEAATIGDGAMSPSSMATFIGPNFRVKADGTFQFGPSTDGLYYTAIPTGAGSEFSLGFSDAGEV